MAKMLLIDGHAVAYRGFHATAHSGNILTTSAGEWTNAVYVFINKLLKAWHEEAPDYIVVTFDVGETFRNEQYPEYKANRSKMPDELGYQIERIKQVISAFNIPIAVCEGYEADDVLGTLASQAAEQGIDSIIMTGDTDMFQLVDDHISVLIPRGRYGDDTLYGPEELQDRFHGLTPQQLIDFKALVGDNSDNIPGVKGIGEKTATALLAAYNSVENIYDHLDEIESKRSRDALAGHRDQVLLYKDLITIRRDAPIELDLEHARAGNFLRDDVLSIFGELEFHSLLDRIPETKAMEETSADQEPHDQVKTKYHVVDGEQKLDRMIAALGTQAFAFDTETTSTDPMTAALVGISLSNMPGQAWYIPVGHGRYGQPAHEDQHDNWSGLPLFQDQPSRTAPLAPSLSGEHQESQLPIERIVERLKPILENPDIPKYAHNASYDITVLAQAANIHVQGLAFDTMIAEWVIDPASRDWGLKAMAFNRLGIEMTPITDLIGKGSSQITMDQVPIDRAAPYACADADMTFRLVEPLTHELKERQQWELFASIEMPMIPILTQMEMTGVRLDVEYLAQMSRSLRQEQAKIERRIFDIVGHEFNVNSTKQLSEVLFQELDLPKQGIRKTTHGYSTAADVLELFRGKHPVIEQILEHRQISKLESTYVAALPSLVNPRTGRVHTSYNQTGTVTGRLSSSNPNLQNIPIRTELGRQIRRGFVAREGWVFVAADYSQVELRILAHVSQDAQLLDAFHRGQDVHARTAAAVYDIPIDQVNKDQRRIAKTVNFGLIYGQSAYGLSQQTELDFDEAERFIKAYFDRYPRVKEWLDKTRKLAYAQGYVETLLGRRRYFPELQSTQRALAGRRAAAERQAINAPIQGTAADILKIAMIRLDRRLRERNLQAKMVLQVHDEIVLEVPREELDEILALTRQVMEHAYSLSVPLRVDVEVGENWYDMRSV
jgi:DNA polymerase-1